MSARAAAGRYLAASKPSQKGRILLTLRVKPGVSKNREGLVNITDEAIELCVAAQPRDGEANKAVISLLSNVLNVPKSQIELTPGSSKSRDKMAVVHDIPGEAQFQRICDHLNKLVHAKVPIAD